MAASSAHMFVEETAFPSASNGALAPVPLCRHFKLQAPLVV